MIEERFYESDVWWYLSVNPTFVKQRKKDNRPIWATMRPTLSQTKQQKTNYYY